MKTITYKQISSAAENLVTACSRVTPSCIRAMTAALEKEGNQNAKTAISMLLSNAALAEGNGLAVCQDTGMAVFFVRLGQDVHVDGGLLTDAINEGVRIGYEKTATAQAFSTRLQERTRRTTRLQSCISSLSRATTCKSRFCPKGLAAKTCRGCLCSNRRKASKA